MGNRVVVAGIGTDVGKTVVSAILSLAWDAHYWKPVQCGLPSDREWIASLGIPCFPERFCLEKPISPHYTAGIEAKLLIPPTHEKLLIIEGTGGILAPLNDSETWFDAAISWEAEWILVHRHYVGSLNHFLLTASFLKERNIPIAGVIFNGEGDERTEEMLLSKANTQCLGRISWQPQLTHKILHELASGIRLLRRS